jgi:drug/metabolite transporter (DMT)-like permease
MTQPEPNLTSDIPATRPKQPAGPQAVNLLLLLLLGTLWGASYLFIKVTVAEVSALTLVAGRLLLGACLLWLLLVISRQPIPRSRQVWAAYAVMGLLNGAIPWTLISWGEQYITSGLAALLQATMPIFTVILAYFLAQEERITPLKILGIVVGFVGVTVLMLPDLQQGLQSSLWGQLAVVASSLSYAGATIFARKRLMGQPPLASATGQLTMGALYVVPLALLVERSVDLTLSLAALGSWLALTVLGTVVAYVVYYDLLRRSSATFVSTVTYILPVNGLILGALVLGEPLTAAVLLGLALILLGVLLART